LKPINVRCLTEEHQSLAKYGRRLVEKQGGSAQLMYREVYVLVRLYE